MRRALPVLMFACAIALLTGLSEARENALLRTPIEALPGKEITLLSTAWCGYCDAARTFLERNQVAFRELDVETNSNGQTLYQRLGAPGVPVLVVDGEATYGMNVRGWIRTLTHASGGTRTR